MKLHTNGSDFDILKVKAVCKINLNLMNITVEKQCDGLLVVFLFSIIQF